MKTYIIEQVDSNIVKIGRSTKPENRIRSIKSGNPFIKLYHTTDGDYENYLHRALHEYRLTGEWFDLTSLVEKGNEDSIFDLIHFLMWIRLGCRTDCEAIEILITQEEYQLKKCHNCYGKNCISTCIRASFLKTLQNIKKKEK